MPERGSLDAVFWKALLVAGTLWLLYLCLDIVLLTLFSIVLAAAILPLADALQKRKIPRSVTVGGLYAIGLGVFALLVALLVPAITEQAQILSERLPQFHQTVNSWIASARAGLGRLGGGRAFELPSIGLEKIGPLAQALIERSLQATRGLLTAAIAGVLVLFVAGYIVIDRLRLANGLLRFVPRPSRDRTAKVAADVMRRMGGYIRGQLIVSLCAVVLLTVGLALVGFEAPLLIGVVAGALNFVPYLGSTVSLILAILLTLNSSIFTIVGVLSVFAVEQFVEGHFLVPYFTGRQVELHPLAVLAALIVGANLAGILGALVAVPLTAGIDAVLQDVYVKANERKHVG
jgi:predicted PurR-regulated permease PerM